MNISRSHSLKAEIEKYAQRFLESNPLQRAAEAGSLSPDTVAVYLSGIHHMVRFTPTALVLAESRARELGDLELAHHYRRKQEEETGHDEWSSSDLIRLGRRFSRYVSYEPVPTAIRITEFQRSTIAQNPKAYLAYVLFVEYVTVLVGPAWVRALEERCGISSDMLSVVVQHAELDKEHVEEGLREIDALIGDDEELESLGQTLQATMRRFDDFYREVYCSGSKSERLEVVAHSPL